MSDQTCGGCGAAGAAWVHPALPGVAACGAACALACGPGGAEKRKPGGKSKAPNDANTKKAKKAKTPAKPRAPQPSVTNDDLVALNDATDARHWTVTRDEYGVPTDFTMVPGIRIKRRAGILVLLAGLNGLANELGPHTGDPPVWPDHEPFLALCKEFASQVQEATGPALVGRLDDTTFADDVWTSAPGVFLRRTYAAASAGPRVNVDVAADKPFDWPSRPPPKLSAFYEKRARWSTCAAKVAAAVVAACDEAVGPGGPYAAPPGDSWGGEVLQRYGARVAAKGCVEPSLLHAALAVERGDMPLAATWVRVLRGVPTDVLRGGLHDMGRSRRYFGTSGLRLAGEYRADFDFPSAVFTKFRDAAAAPLEAFEQAKSKELVWGMHARPEQKERVREMYALAGDIAGLSYLNPGLTDELVVAAEPQETAVQMLTAMHDELRDADASDYPDSDSD